MLLVVVVGTGYLLVPVERSRISQATCDKVQLGWTWDEALAVLGRDGLVPWAEQREGEFAPVGFFYDDEDKNRILVKFDSNVRVSEKQFTPTILSACELAKRRIERRLRALWP